MQKENISLRLFKIILFIVITIFISCKKEKNLDNNTSDNKNDSINNPVASNAPNVMWQKCLGGSDQDYIRSIKATNDGGFILIGSTFSNDGDVSGNHGPFFSDIWVVKLNSSANIEWQKCLGGTNHDNGFSIAQTNDGGYIVAGGTVSVDGDVTGNHGGYSDAWVVKLDNTGNIIWKQCYGGTGGEGFYSVLQTADGGYVLGGITYSNDGDVSGNHGNIDFWIVKINSTGTLLWQKCYGGSVADRCESIIQTNDGGFIAAGSTESTDGNVSGNHGPIDAWVIKLTSNGTLQWQRCFGGSANGADGANSIIQLSNGNLLFAGHTASNDGDVSGNHGDDDFWIVKFDINGSLLSQKCLGGTKMDFARTIIQTNDGGIAIAGETLSDDGDVNGNHGAQDFWITKLNANDSLEWQKCLGGSNSDRGYSLIQNADGSIILAGETSSNDSNVTNFHGGVVDGWIVKIQ